MTTSPCPGSSPTDADDPDLSAAEASGAGDVPSPLTDPEQAVDALEDRAVDDDLRPDEDAEWSESAFDIDLPPEQQGDADAGDEQTA